MGSNSDDRHMGAATVIDIRGREVRVDGNRILSYSARLKEAYGDAAPGFGLAVWTLSPTQVEHLLDKAPHLQLSKEAWGSEHAPGCPKKSPGRSRKTWAGTGWAFCDGCDRARNEA